MALKFAVITSEKINSPLRVRRVPDKVKPGDKVNGQKAVLTFLHEEVVARRPFTSTKRKSNRGKKELELLVAMMDFVRATNSPNGTELERLLTSAFQAGMQFHGQ